MGTEPMGTIPMGTFVDVVIVIDKKTGAVYIMIGPLVDDLIKDLI